MKEEDWDIKLLDYITGEVIDEKERRKIELWIGRRTIRIEPILSDTNRLSEATLVLPE